MASQVLQKWKANKYSRLCLDSLANAAGLPQLTRLIFVQSPVLPLDEESRGQPEGVVVESPVLHLDEDEDRWSPFGRGSLWSLSERS